MKQNTKYAFWKYDLFPYVLSGKVTKTFPGGKVEIEGYGSGTTGFKPICVVRGNRGLEIKNNLDNLKTLRANILHQTELEFNKQIYVLCPELGKKT